MMQQIWFLVLTIYGIIVGRGKAARDREGIDRGEFPASSVSCFIKGERGARSTV